MRRHFKKYIPDHQAISANRWLRPFRNTLLHPRLWHLNRHSAAGAVAAGLFCGLIPGPLQMPSAALCAVIFKVNLPLAMVVTLYTNPLTLVPIYLLAYQIGRFFLARDTPFVAPPEFDASQAMAWMEAMQLWMLGVAKPLGLGLVLLAVNLAIIGYFTVKSAWCLYLIRAHRKRKARG
jgi:uncharacterized protein